MAKYNFAKSIRIPQEWHKFMIIFADKKNMPTSAVYRLAMLEFIQKNQE